MNMWTKIIIGVVAAAVIGAGGYYYFINYYEGSLGEPLGKGAFACDEGKTIDAVFYQEKGVFTLSDGRKITLSQDVAASGVQYANEEETIVFWSKGDEAFITEGVSKVQTFRNCVTVIPGEEAKSSYASSTLKVSLKYPKSYVLDEKYKFQFNAEKSISGAKFSVPPSMATGTNLSDDSGVSLEVLPRAIKCTGDIYLKANVKASTVTENGVSYSVASSSDAGAGNFYEEIVYAYPESSPCIALRYFIHSTNIGNYPEGTVREFDRKGLLEALDKIRQSVLLNK